MPFQNYFDNSENHGVAQPHNRTTNAAPLTPEANEKAARDIPRDPETFELFKKIIGAGPLPAR